MSWECLLDWIEHHPGLASWVQAVGSIAAIFVAIWVSGSEQRHRMRIERSARKDLVARAISAAEHAKKITQNNVEFFTSRSLPRSEMPKFLAVVENAALQVRDVSLNPAIDDEIHGHVLEVTNSLVDVRSQIESCVSSLENDYSVQVAYLKSNVHRIERAMQKLKAVKL